MLLGTYGFAYWRRESQEFWDGSFLDKESNEDILKHALEEKAEIEEAEDNSSNRS